MSKVKTAPAASAVEQPQSVTIAPNPKMTVYPWVAINLSLFVESGPSEIEITVKALKAYRESLWADYMDGFHPFYLPTLAVVDELLGDLMDMIFECIQDLDVKPSETLGHE